MLTRIINTNRNIPTYKNKIAGAVGQNTYNDKNCSPDKMKISLHILKDFKNAPAAKMLFHVEIEYFHCVKNKLTSSVF